MINHVTDVDFPSELGGDLPEVESLFSKLYMNLLAAGVNVERRIIPDTSDNFLRCILATPYQMLEVRVYDDDKNRHVNLTSLSYEIHCEPEDDPNRTIKAIGNEFWVAMRYIGEYSHPGAFTENVEDHLISRPGRSSKET